MVSQRKTTVRLYLLIAVTLFKCPAHVSTSSEMVDLFRLGDPADLWATDLATSQTVTLEQMLGTAGLMLNAV